MSAPDNAPHDFTRRLIDDLANSGYAPSAWRRFISQSWQRSVDDVRTSPSLTRSFLLSAGVYLVAGTGLIVLTWAYHAAPLPGRSLALWLPWYAVSVGFVLTHLGMADDEHGLKNRRFNAPNQLSFTRFALAPLVMVPCLVAAPHPATGPVFAVFIVGMSLTDALDGWIARRQGVCTRLGQMLDYLADLAFLTFLAIGLYLANAIPVSLLWLLLIRYPLTLVAALILYFTRGPASLAPTFLGRLTTLATSVVLLLISLGQLLGLGWLPSAGVSWLIQILQVLVAVNIFYLVYLGMIWGKSPGGHPDIVNMSVNVKNSENQESPRE